MSDAVLSDAERTVLDSCIDLGEQISSWIAAVRPSFGPIHPIPSAVDPLARVEEVNDMYLRTFRRVRTMRSSGMGIVGSMFSAANASVGDVVGYTPLLEGCFGVDLTEGRDLSTAERWVRGGIGGVSIVMTLVPVIRVPKGSAPRPNQKLMEAVRQALDDALSPQAAIRLRDGSGARQVVDDAVPSTHLRKLLDAERYFPDAVANPDAYARRWAMKVAEERRGTLMNDVRRTLTARGRDVDRVLAHQTWCVGVVREATTATHIQMRVIITCSSRYGMSKNMQQQVLHRWAGTEFAERYVNLRRAEWQLQIERTLGLDARRAHSREGLLATHHAEQVLTRWASGDRMVRQGQRSVAAKVAPAQRVEAVSASRPFCQSCAAAVHVSGAFPAGTGLRYTKVQGMAGHSR